MNLRNLFPILGGSAVFAVKRKLLPIARETKIRYVVVDLDGTLFSGSSHLDALAMRYGGMGKARAIHQGLFRKYDAGKITLDGALLKLFQALLAKKMGRSDWHALMERYEREGKVNRPLIEALKYAQRHGKKVILATRMARESAEWFNQRYGFDGAIGTTTDSEAYRGRGDVPELVGIRRGWIGKTHVKTKLDKVRELLRGRGVPFRAKSVAVISNDYLDHVEMQKAGLGILLTPTGERTELERIAQKYALFDVAARNDERLAQRVKLILRKPRFAAYPNRLEQASERLTRVKSRRY